MTRRVKRREDRGELRGDGRRGQEEEERSAQEERSGEGRKKRGLGI